MNGKAAKGIRRKIYGDRHHGAVGRKYVQDRRTLEITADSFRRAYQLAKRFYLAGSGGSNAA